MKSKSKAAVAKKSTGGSALKRLAARAMKLVKPKKPAAPRRPAAKSSARSGPAPRKAKARSAKARSVDVSGLTERDMRRMSESEYMNDTQFEFFRARLLQMRQEVVTRELDVKERLHQREVFADPADRATAEEEHWLDLRLREREALLVKKIDDALRRIKDREYGYCTATGEPIGIPRLLARPTATVCVDVKGQNEQVEAQYRDR